jgi:hypothetical protein
MVGSLGGGAGDLGVSIINAKNINSRHEHDGQKVFLLVTPRVTNSLIPAISISIMHSLCG